MLSWSFCASLLVVTVLGSLHDDLFVEDDNSLVLLQMRSHKLDASHLNRWSDAVKLDEQEEVSSQPTARVNREAFIAAANTASPQAAHNPAFTQYLNLVFDAATGMMLPEQKTDLGSHCTAYAMALSKEFYLDGTPQDGLNLVGGEAKTPELQSVRSDLGNNWVDVAKDNEGRVTRDAFKASMNQKFAVQIVGKEGAFADFLDRTFSAGLGMMLPAAKSTLGKHCFSYSALMAGEFYFDGSGIDAAHLVSAVSAVSSQPTARVNREAFIAAGKTASPEAALNPAFTQYLNLVFDAAIGMMLPKAKTDLGRHCTAYAMALSKEFYLDGSPQDSLNLVGGEAQTPELQSVRSDLGNNWVDVAKDDLGRVTRDAFKASMNQKFSAQIVGKEGAFADFLDRTFSAGLGMMLPEAKTTLGKHCFSYSALMAGEFYFDGSGLDTAHLVSDSLNSVSSQPTARVNRQAFIAAGKAASPQAALNPAFMQYLNLVFDAATGMMLPKAKNDLGSHCTAYALALSKEFYLDGTPQDSLNLVGGEAQSPELQSVRSDLGNDWVSVAKDDLGRVTRDAFKASMTQKFSAQIVGKGGAFANFLDRIFSAGLGMMLPAAKTTLGKHCFSYSALMAGEFYFDGHGLDTANLVQ